MGELLPFTLTIDGEDHEVLPENHGIAMFRRTPEYDYIDLSTEIGPDEEVKHIMIFRQQWLCHWMGGLALNQPDAEHLRDTREELGSFRERFGWNSPVMIEDSAREFEVNMFTESLLSDLKGSDTIPEGWSNE